MKRKTKTKVRFAISNFEAVKGKFLLDIKRVTMIEEIPDELVINWDQTGIKFLRGRWLRRDPREGVNDKRKITAVFADFLPVHLVYERTASQCYPSGVNFPACWFISATPNHWCNVEIMFLYIIKIIIPYLQ